MKKMKQLIMLILMIVLVSISGKMTALADEESLEENVAFTEVNDEAGLIAAIENGENVKLTADFALTSEVKIDASLIVDLNGKTVTSALNKKIFIVTGNGVKVKFTDSSVNESGLLKAIGTYGSSVAIYVEKTASVIIEKGTYIGGFASVDIELSSSVTITGGTFDGIESYYAIFNDGGNLNIHGGTFKSAGNPIVSMNSGMTKVTGGEFYNENTSVTIVMLQYEGGTLDLSGFTGKEYKVDFLEVPSTEQIIIPEKYAWFDWSNNKYDEVNSERFLILSKLVKLSFNANGGSGTMASVETVAGECELPKCEFVAPDGLGFLGWSETPNGDEYTRLYYDATSDMTLYAIWGKVYDVYMGNVGMEDGDYLVVGADKTTKTKPSTGGYAYYNDGVLTLNNYVHGGGEYLDEYGYASSLYVRDGDLKILVNGVNKITNDSEYGILLYYGDLTISGDGSLEISAYDGGIYVSGDVKIDSVSLDVSGNTAVSIEKDLIIDGATLNIQSEYGIGVKVYNKVEINSGLIYIRAYDGAIGAFNGITINSEKVEIIVPQEGCISSDGRYIEDSDGNDVSTVLIAPVATHTWSEDYVYNADSHWHICSDAECFLSDYSSLYKEIDESEYDYHDTNGVNGVCSVCGYDIDKEVAVYVGGVGLADGEYLANNGLISKTKPATGGYAYYKDGVLTLSDYEYKGEGYWYEYDYSTIIYSELDELEVVLEGENLLKNTEQECEGITFAGNTLKISGTGSLKVDAYYGIYVFGEFDADGLLISDNALIIEDGNITIESDDDAIYCEGRLTINGGKLTIDAFDDGIVTYDDFTMNDGEIYIFTVDDDAFDLSGDANVTIKGGIINIESRDDGFSLWGSFIIEDGVVNITSTNDDGIWAETGIIIRGGSITLDASDNGISTAGDVLVEAGVVTVKCEGYCFESSGKVEINGGVVILNTSSDKENDDIAAIMAFEEIVFGENVEMKIPKGVKIGEIKVEYDSPEKFDYFKVLEDADGDVATSVKIQEKLQLKEAVTLNNPVLVIGQKLSTVKLNNVKVVNPFGDIIEGTISWKEPDTVIGAATKTATWVFTPSNSAYDVIEGTISLPGAIEAPDTGDMSPVSWLMVGMLLIVVCVCGMSLKRENYN